VRHHIIDAQCNEIASAQFSIDRQIEEGQVAYTQLKVQLGPKDQTCPGRSGGLGPIILPLSITVNDLCSAVIEGRSRSWVISSFARPPRCGDDSPNRWVRVS
jgi:hypothetical protein